MRKLGFLEHSYPMDAKRIRYQVLLGFAMVVLFGGLSFANLGFFKSMDRAIFHLDTALFGYGKIFASHSPIAAKHILDGSFPEQAGFTRYVELGLLLILGGGMSFVSPRLSETNRFYLFAALLLILLGIAATTPFVVHAWLRTASLITALAAIYLAVTFYRASALETVALENSLANKALGLDLQRQGYLDQAFERFRICHMDQETEELLYRLGLEYEERGLTEQALMAYELIKRKDTEDVRDRIKRIQSDKSSGQNSNQLPDRQADFSESLVQARKMIGRYQITENLGKGTMSLVYKGLDPKLNRPVAIKIIRFSDEFDEEMIKEIRERFLREAEIAGRLSHPGIVTVYDVGEDQDFTYMAMEYLEGENLIPFCSKENRLPLIKVLDIVAKVADALDYAHRNEVIHRDIKPANIMLLKNSEIKVTDFGIAKGISSIRTKTGVILGTPNYMSPEQIMGHKIDGRSDIFALGVLFFQLLTGQLPFHGENLSGLLYDITQGAHPSVRQIESRIPKACEQIIDKALAKNPRDRFRNAGQMAKYLYMLISRIEEMSKNRG